MTLKDADEIIGEAKLFGWGWVVMNAECYGLTSSEMLAFWRRNQHMTPTEPFFGDVAKARRPARRRVAP